MRLLKNTKVFLFLMICFCCQPFMMSAQDEKKEDNIFDHLKFRNIGPAFMSGRIADIAIHPTKKSTWYVAVGSGGVWKTENAGTTWQTVFDKEASYSTGCITIDPIDHNTIWLGTGENVGGRHVGYGDGIYKSIDGGKTWKNMGLKKSERISEIIVHPNNSNVVWVAVQGPLWTKGGERGLYKTTDGGKTWKKTLAGANEWTGTTDIILDHQNPDILYAANWQRHRTIAAYMGGGPGTSIHKSIDGGMTWSKLSTGLPTSNMGKLGIAQSPFDNNVLYAAIELDARKGGVYKSTDAGQTWSKQSDAVSGGTGPHYYQELYACPHKMDRIYLMDVRMQVSEDGGKTFNRVPEEHKHSDNHALVFDKDNSEYLMAGTDGGIYESFDRGKNWRFIKNLPITQFYKLAVDDAEPFYNVFGGTQDNSTEGGPSRTNTYHGIENAHWSVVLNWDGHQPATEPGNPNIMYGQRQQGTLSRIDMLTGEVIDIQPQAGAGEPHERYNWDAPILVSQHDPKRLYFASYRLWRSDDRGDSWKALSGDLTKNQNRVELPIMGKKQSLDNAWDVYAMSNFNTITSIAESPQNEDLIYIGTDDGIIQVTEDGGRNWTKIMVSSLPNVPSNAYINDIKADLFDENTVYIALDNHKEGDFKPYLLKSTNKGKSWNNIATDLPDRHLVWRIVQDHKKEDLLFIGTEFGIFASGNGGTNWVELNGNIPTISFRDLTIHRRDNDLIAASFGRGFFILDDISAFREWDGKVVSDKAKLIAPNKTWWYTQRSRLSFGDEKGSQGAAHFTSPNPDFGARFTCYFDEISKSLKELRQEKEKELNKNNQNIPFPGWETYTKENYTPKTKFWLAISDDKGMVVRNVDFEPKKGFQKITWDLRYSSMMPKNSYMGLGMMALPGTYSAQIFKLENGTTTAYSEKVNFDLTPLQKGAIENPLASETKSFWTDYENTFKQSIKLGNDISSINKNLEKIKAAVHHSRADISGIQTRIQSLIKNYTLLSEKAYGNSTKIQVGEKTQPTIQGRIFAVFRTLSHSTYGPTPSAKKQLEIIKNDIATIEKEAKVIKQESVSIAKSIMDNGGPVIQYME